MSRLSNALSMLDLLSTGQKYNINDLAKILEVTPRMVRCYKEDLEKAGIYIETLYGPLGGYVLKQNFKLPKRKFSASDYEFLASLKVDSKDQEKLNIIADKMRGIYFESESEKELLPLEQKQYYNKIVRAIKNGQKVEIKYYSYNKGENNRVIHPYSMFLTASGWVVSAYCEKRDDLRNFELKRIRELILLDQYFDKD